MVGNKGGIKSYTWRSLNRRQLLARMRPLKPPFTLLPTLSALGGGGTIFLRRKARYWKNFQHFASDEILKRKENVTAAEEATLITQPPPDVAKNNEFQTEVRI